MPIFKVIILFSFGFYRILEVRKRAITNGVTMNKIHLQGTCGIVHKYTFLDIGLAKLILCFWSLQTIFQDVKLISLRQ